jgi:basic membrane lipoprotein Med (substrate-binding protein (PBP1-ABC) superfamily)
MLWSEVKRWAKDKGYETIKDKGDEEKGDKVQYYWSKIDSPSSSGVSPSVSKLARDIYNDITNGEWIDYQILYKESH